MTIAQRQDRILAHLNTHERGTVIELSRLLEVTEVTIRKDLGHLQDQGLVTRLHGGAAISGRGRLERHLAARENEHKEEKQRIARTAAGLIQSGQRIFLDASTTALFVARLIKDRRDLVVITNGLYTAVELSYCDGISTIVLGGAVRHRSSSLVGSLSDAVTQRLRVDLGFFGARGLTPRDGLMEADLDEAQLKHNLVKASNTVIGIADSSKFGPRYLSAFALPDEVQRIITDIQAPPAMVAELRTYGIQVDLV
jgi:DeoR/GlpR family transcriptional regulator of sugar metabolism